VAASWLTATLHDIDSNVAPGSGHAANGVCRPVPLFRATIKACFARHGYREPAPMSNWID
jgi:hypothetical protein